MNKIGQYLYNTLFWISRFITLSVFGICFFAILNAKYVWSETFFTKLINFSLYISYFIHSLIDFNNISNILKSSFYTATSLINSNNISDIVNISFYAAPTETLNIKYNLFRKFCINTQQVDILLLSILSILVISICIRILIKKSIYCDLVVIFVVYLLLYLYTSLIGILFLPLMTLFIFLTAIFVNKCLTVKNIIKYIPIIGELFCIDLILNKILNRTIDKQKIIFIILMEALICSNMLYFITPFKDDNFTNRIMDKRTYSISVLHNKIMLATSPISILYDDNNYFSIDNANFNYIEDIIINNSKNEIYIYDDEREKLVFLNLDNLKIIDELNFRGISNGSDARIRCDDSMSKLLIAFEDSKTGAFLIDLNNHTVIGEYKIASPSDSIIYNKYRNSFIITFFQWYDFMQEIKCDNSKNVEIIDSDSFQGYICISNRNKEVYVAFHQQGRIGVYDAQTMKLKRKIKTNYTVKGITYDEELNILIAPAYFTGYVDIFLMDGTDKLLTREFVGYELREAKFDFKKENLYAASKRGLYKKKIDVKKLIANVSHETK